LLVCWFACLPFAWLFGCLVVYLFAYASVLGLLGALIGIYFGEIKGQR
jgi:hypothetical protein